MQADKKRILLVEDDPFLSEIYVTKFEESGFAVAVLKNGVLGIEKIKEQKPDIILLDIVMPKIDGFEFLQMIKDDTATKNVPVVILSNLAEQENVEKGFALGATAYLVKAHYTPTEVVAKVREILNTK